MPCPKDTVSIDRMASHFLSSFTKIPCPKDTVSMDRMASHLNKITFNENWIACNYGTLE